mmetsp:Transcript_23674/g.45051  ORF Transcript_23674/g.45051 Transcript_23674/m.45051 type:complete len:270 (+) Transcript_23674:212-1021(+)
MREVSITFCSNRVRRCDKESLNACPSNSNSSSVIRSPSEAWVLSLGTTCNSTSRRMRRVHSSYSPSNLDKRLVMVPEVDSSPSIWRSIAATRSNRVPFGSTDSFSSKRAMRVLTGRLLVSLDVSVKVCGIVWGTTAGLASVLVATVSGLNCVPSVATTGCNVRLGISFFGAATMVSSGLYSLGSIASSSDATAGMMESSNDFFSSKAAFLLDATFPFAAADPLEIGVLLFLPLDTCSSMRINSGTPVRRAQSSGVCPSRLTLSTRAFAC